MKCQTCRIENREGRKFCAGCGARLAVICAACAAPNEFGEAFCGECGARLVMIEVAAAVPDRAPASYTPKHLADRILQSRSALEGERKQVTVLFADVKGSMELAEQLDPEEWHRILERFFAILTEGVHRFEGTVNQYTGDGIMALFGAPIAHEDHAQRACYAALHLRDALRGYADELRRTQGLSFSTRIGIHSGEVVVGRIGDDLRMDYTAQGHTVGIAQRMEQLAAADSAHVSAATARLVEGYFVLRDLGEFALKGSGAPMHVFELRDVGALRTRLDSSRARGLSAFVGRVREMASLESALEAALAGNGQVVGVVADAGTGKSRLCFEFVERCKARGIRVNAAHCPSHGKTVPYLPLLEMLRDIFGIEARDSDHETRRKIAGELMLLDAAFQALLPMLFEFMGVGDPANPAPALSPEARQEQLLAFVRHLVQARGQREPTVLFLDDAHWIDPASDLFLAHAVEAAAQSRTLWLVNFRPEYHAPWMSKSFYQQLPLQPLGAQAIAELLSDLLGVDPSVAPLLPLVESRTHGNPFFIEEIVQSLAESGHLIGGRGNYRLSGAIDALDIPPTVQSVLAARLDRQGEREKRVLQMASVIGKTFPATLLREVVLADSQHEFTAAELMEALTELGRAEFIFEAALYPDVEYSFKHPLTQEVAYRSQLNVRRSAVHGAVARAIERIDAERLDERAALLAHHCEQAGEPLAAAEWHARAAAVAGFDNPAEALRHWERVWELLRPLEGQVGAASLRLNSATFLLNLGWRLGTPEDQVTATFAEACELAAALGDPREQVRLHYAYALNFAIKGAPHRAIPVLEAGLAMANASGEPELRWTIGEAYEFALWQIGELDRAMAVSDGQLVLADQDPRIGIAMVGISTANSLCHRGMFLGDLGRFEEAKATYRAASERARALDDDEVAGWIEGHAAVTLVQGGETKSALSMILRAIEKAESTGSEIVSVVWHGCHGLALLGCNEPAAAVESLTLSIERGRAIQVGSFHEARFLAALAEAHLQLGEQARAQALVDEAVAVATQMENAVGEVCAQLARARVLMTGDAASAHADIEAALQRAESLVASTGARAYAPQIVFERARLALHANDPARHARLLRQAYEEFVELGAHGHAQRLAELLAEGTP